MEGEAKGKCRERPDSAIRSIPFDFLSSHYSTKGPSFSFRLNPFASRAMIDGSFASWRSSFAASHYCSNAVYPASLHVGCDDLGTTVIGAFQIFRAPRPTNLKPVA